MKTTLLSDDTVTKPKAVRTENPFWWAPWIFAVHALVGTSIFSIIAGVSIVLDFGVQELQLLGVNGVIFFGLKMAEYALFGADLCLFAIFLWRTARRTITSL